jgi:hypothetical protein
MPASRASQEQASAIAAATNSLVIFSRISLSPPVAAMLASRPVGRAVHGPDATGITGASAG